MARVTYFPATPLCRICSENKRMHVKRKEHSFTAWNYFTWTNIAITHFYVRQAWAAHSNPVNPPMVLEAARAQTCYSKMKIFSQYSKSQCLHLHIRNRLETLLCLIPTLTRGCWCYWATFAAADLPYLLQQKYSTRNATLFFFLH